MTMFERVERAHRIAALRASHPPKSWAEVAKTVGLSQAACRNAYAEFLRFRAADDDPMGFVDQTIDALTLAMAESADTAAHADPGSAARTGAVRVFMESATTRLALMQAAGKVPRYLGQFAAEREMRVIFEEFAKLLERHNITGPVLDDFIALARDMAGRRQRAIPQQASGEAQAA